MVVLLLLAGCSADLGLLVIEPTQHKAVDSSTLGLVRDPVPRWTGRPAHLTAPHVDPTLDGTPMTPSPWARVDVLVIGAGPSGLAAGHEAAASGADTLIIEMGTTASTGAKAATRMWAVDTAMQALLGIEDSVDLAISEWPDIAGTETANPLVQTFIAESAETLDWLGGLGASFTNVVSDPQTGSIARLHEAKDGLGTAVDAVVEDLDDAIWFEVRADALITDAEGAVVGAWVTDLQTEEQGWVSAQAVVVASGGFARNEALLVEAAPALADLEWVAEAMPHADGNGLLMMQDAGAGVPDLAGHLGVYGHSVHDPRRDPGVAMVVGDLPKVLIVDSTGARVRDEDDSRSFGMGRELMDRGVLYAVLDDAHLAELILSSMPFSRSSAPEGVETGSLMGPEYAELADLAQGNSVAELAADLGVDAEVLDATITTYNAAVEAGHDEVFGKDMSSVDPLDAMPLWALELAAGPAKSYVGAQLDEQARVLDVDGAVIPGLYAAGEAAGVLGSDSAGHGWSGSVSAVWWSGRYAGQWAAAGLDNED